MLSVIMPAYNEAEVIGEAIARFLAQGTDVPFELIVVPNGCTDGTADIARRFVPEAQALGLRLHVEERAEAGKIGALNAGDREARFGDRLYCDGDLLVSPSLVQAAADALSGARGPRFVGFKLVVRPPVSRVTAAYARLWSKLPLLAKRPHGIALYAVNAAGRARWGEFPNIVADDHFARLNFAPSERVRTDAASYEFAMPEGLRELLAVRTRWARGNEELAAKLPHLLANEDSSGRYEEFLGSALKDPVAAATFLGVYAVGKVQGIRRADEGTAAWERAEASRRSENGTTS